ncbi:baseplate wedge subunit [Serratia phage CHI14]|uniref:Baseplate wedge protein gp6 n=2 Tax=Winklervirus chi14 TaxID=2560752 RepID=A0A1Z1LYF4_9CAUD|nr:baseplate wedge subunit [Serratia phage CHI14]ARW57581.1 baseplate wedge subunit [Serratia phage CHI14]ARW57856.1 baseplate wedge subunit [Serratia phage CBH8]UYM28812.1 baseplate wedge subunit [Serratia phage vB_SspM_LC53]
MANQPVNYQLTRTVNAIPEAFVGATFDEIKKNLTDWLRGQKEFQDYDFQGARINVLLDLLAYNTLYMQQFANTAIYESFIGTANQRSSVVQAAQDNGYLPSSRSSAQTSLLLTCSHATNPSNIKIPRGTRFLAYARDTSADPYSFVVLEDVIAIKDSKNQYKPIVKLAQGRLIRTELLYDPTQPILIRDANIDRKQVKLSVNGAEWTDWTNKSMVHAGSTSTIFYMRETVDGHTEFFFGEGVQSKAVAGGVLEANYVGGLKPTTNSSIVIEYLRTDGAKANGATEFSYADTLQYVTVDKITENYDENPDYVGADGGGDPEDIERIRELAVVKREAQMRCVTASDYDTFVSERFGSIVQAVQTFTDIEKPGYAFIAIKPKSGLYLTAVQREDIQNYLNDYNLAPITPSVISPNYLFLKHNIKVSYALNKLQESEQWLRSQVINQIDRYYTEEVEIFNHGFAKSKMLTYVDDSDHSILGSTASISMVREVMNFAATPDAGIKYYNQYKPRTVVSSQFEFVPTTGDSYMVRIASTDKDERGAGLMIIGPFKDGDVKENANIKPYVGTDFDKMPGALPAQTKYYVIGELNYFSDYIYWNIGKIDLTSAQFEVQTIDLAADPTEDNIFTKDGSLIVFEDDLRPQYTSITMEPIAQ